MINLIEHLPKKGGKEITMVRTERLTWIDILKGIGILLVVIGHIYSNDIIYRWLYSFHMPLFFLAGGLVYRKKPILNDIKRRIQTILIPYISFGFFVLLYWQLIERRFRNSSMSFIDSFVGLFIGSYNKLDFNIHLWFLPCFFVTVVLFNVLINYRGQKLSYFVSALMSLIYIIFPMPELFFGVNRVFKFIGFYAVGVAFKDKIMNISYRKRTYELFTLFLLSLNFYLSYHNLTFGIMWFVTALIGIFAMILISQLINKNKVLQYFGRISLIVLCIHGPVYRVVAKIVALLLHISTDGARQNFLTVMIIVIGTMIVCSILYEVVIRVAPWMLGKSKKKY